MTENEDNVDAGKAYWQKVGFFRTSDIDVTQFQPSHARRAFPCFEEQGEKLEVIEENVETALVAIHEGVEKLAEAEGYLNAARKKKLLILVVVVIIVLAITIGLIVFGTS